MTERGLSTRVVSKLTGESWGNVRKLKMRLQLPGLKRGDQIMPIDVLYAMTAGAFQKDYGFSRQQAQEIVGLGKGLRIVRSIAHRLDDDLTQQAFFAIASSRQPPKTDRWCVVGHGVTLAQVLGKPPNPSRLNYERIVAVDVGRCAREIHAQAKKHGIKFDRFTREDENFDDITFSPGGVGN